MTKTAPDIVERLLDFDRYGASATDRVAIREEAAHTIFTLRRRVRVLEQVLWEDGPLPWACSDEPNKMIVEELRERWMAGRSGT